MSERVDKYYVSDVSGERLPEDGRVPVCVLWHRKQDAAGSMENCFLTMDLSAMEAARLVNFLLGKSNVIGNVITDVFDACFGDKWRHRLDDL